jgi:hypothetical protein
MAIALNEIYDLLRPGLFGVKGKYEQIPTQWDKVFDKANSKMAVERTADMRYTGLAYLKNEGGATVFDNAEGERYIYNQEHMEIGLGYAITRKAIDDNLYKTQFNPSNLGLVESFAQTKEIFGANVLNTGNVYQTQVGGDGVALMATNHPVDGGTFANTPSTPLSLNESAIYSGLIQIRQFVDNANLKTFSRGRKLIVPLQLEYVAVRLTKTELRVGTADNDINALLHASNGLPEGYMVMDFLTSATAWFIKTDKPGLQYFSRVPYETDMFVDFATDNLLVKGYERYSFSYWDPRAIWGSFATM